MDEHIRRQMIEIRQREIKKVISEIEERSAGGNYIYRGEPKDYGKVSSSLWRECQEKMREVDFNIEFVQEEILKNAPEYGLNPNEDKLEFMSQLQHYGGATNLIDFTTDYHIALFFACNDSIMLPGQVILLQRNEQTNKKYKINRAKQPISRIKTQKSIFVQPPKGYIEPPDIDIVTIRPILKSPFLRDRHPMLTYLQKYHGISNATIYNDFHGFIKRQNTYQAACKQFYLGESEKSKGDLLEEKSPKKQQHYSSAIRHYHLATNFNPNYVDAYLNRAFLYNSVNKYDKVIEDCEHVIELDPQNLRAHDLRDAAQKALERLNESS